VTVIYNDAHGVSGAVSADGVVLFARRDGVLSTGSIVVPGWVSLAGDALDFFATIASGTGATTPLPAVTTATTGIL